MNWVPFVKKVASVGLGMFDAEAVLAAPSHVQPRAPKRTVGEYLAAMCSSAGIQVVRVDDEGCEIRTYARGRTWEGGALSRGSFACVFMNIWVFDHGRVPQAVYKIADALKRRQSATELDILEGRTGTMLNVVWKGNMAELDAGAMRVCVKGLTDYAANFWNAMREQGYV